MRKSFIFLLIYFLPKSLRPADTKNLSLKIGIFYDILKSSNE
jgi:hypothetical protein